MLWGDNDEMRFNKVMIV
uniref:Uncharacterized protein n=1 Tax=Rhizophora mucronata TaxID=61149 RepID=A0A2P2PLU9_RHIMU